MAKETPKTTIRVLRKADRLWALDASDPRALTGIIASTDQLTTASVRLRPRGRSTVRDHRGSAGRHVPSGRVNVLLENSESLPVWFELHPADGFFLPEGTRYRLINMGGEEVEVTIGVAPDYRSAAPA